MRVLVVDDSVVFRSQIKAALSGAAGVEVVGTANNGKIALQKLEQTSVDLITLDMEMPEMNGLETIKAIRQKGFKTKIIVFSAMTLRGSAEAIDALSAGAQDIVTKPSGEGMSFDKAQQQIQDELLPKVMQFQVSTTTPMKPSGSLHPTTPEKNKYQSKDLDVFYPEVIVIGSSTGGPPALENLLKDLPKPLRVPILITQHMPPMFTASLATRLQTLSGITCAEAVHGEPLLANRIYVAPGNYHLYIRDKSGKRSLHLDQAPARNSVRPAVDHLFESAAEIFGTKTLGIVLTGMGEDGKLGAIAIKNAGGGIMIQDRGSCVVFGMPGAIYSEGAFDFMSDIASMRPKITKFVS